MGLDIVEYVMALEAAFGIEIPDRDAEKLLTVRQTVDYLCARLPMVPATDGAGAPSLEQAAFYQLRRLLRERTGVPKEHLRPGTPAREVVTEDEWRPLVTALESAGPRPSRDATLGEVARLVARTRPAALKGPGATWSRAEIEAIVWDLCELQLGIDPRQFTLDSRYVADMGVG
jgi:hypothetical protein